MNSRDTLNLTTGWARLSGWLAALCCVAVLVLAMPTAKAAETEHGKEPAHVNLSFRECRLREL